MTRYLLEIDAPHESLLPLVFAKLREIGVGVGTLTAPPTGETTGAACAECAAPLREAVVCPQCDIGVPA